MLIPMHDKLFISYFPDSIITYKYAINNWNQGQAIVLTALHNLQHSQQRR